MDKYNAIRNEYIYLFREREHILLNNNFYKIGKTIQIGIKRFNNYKGGSEIILLKKVNDCLFMEQQIKKLFKEKYELFEGRETFIGDVDEMEEEILFLCKQEKGKEEKEPTEERIKREKDERIKKEKDEKQNIISAFISEKIIKTDSQRDKIGKRGLLEGFKQWFEVTQGSRKVPKGEELFEYMNKKFGQCKITSWHCVKFVGEEEDDMLYDEL